MIDLERDIKGRLAVRAGIDHHACTVEAVAAALTANGDDGDGGGRRLDEGQVAAVRAITGTGALVLVEGAAGAGKTSVLSAANTITTHQGRSMMVVAPSKKAAMTAAEQIDAESATTAAGLVHQHGYRWDTDGVWTRLHPGQADPTGRVYTGPHASARLASGDVLVVDEAGMLDQETARALLHVADEADARMVFVGGVLEMVSGWAPTQIELGAVHRFRTPGNQVDTEYADLTLRIRSGTDPDTVFDDLHAGGHVKVWASDADALGHVAHQTAHRHLEGVPQAVSWPRTTSRPRSTRS